MKLRTSYFNSTVLKKDITRFAPVWGLYTLFMLMVVFLLRESHSSADRFANSASDIMMTMGVVNFAYGGICAVLLFGDLFTARMCNALHALPMRREGWFLTHFAAGMLFCLVPNALGALAAALLLEQHFYLALLWLGIMVLQFLFFFGAGTFSVMCAGNRLGASAVYAILNFLAVLAAWLIMTFYEPFLHGIELELDQYAYYSPVVGFSQAAYVNTSYGKMEGFEFLGFWPADWRYLFIAASVGVALAALAVLIYRARKLESAGDFISLRPVGPVFLAIYTLCAGAVMYYAADIVAESARYVFLLLGFAIGFFTGRMLLERKVNVFRLKNLLAFGALVAVFGITVGLTWLDPVGVTRYVPRAQQVKQVTVSPYASRYYLGYKGRVLEAQEDIETVVKIHEDLTRDRSMDGNMALRLSYELENGTVVERSYTIDVQEQPAQILKKYFSDWRYVLGTDDIEALLDKAYALEFYSYREDIPNVGIAAADNMMDMGTFTEKFGYENCVTYLVEDLITDEGMVPGLKVELVKNLMGAVQKDCDALCMAQPSEYHRGHETAGHLYIYYFLPRQTDTDEKTHESSAVYDTTNASFATVEISVCQCCANTIRFLKDLKK